MKSLNQSLNSQEIKDYEKIEKSPKDLNNYDLIDKNAYKQNYPFNLQQEKDQQFIDYKKDDAILENYDKQFLWVKMQQLDRLEKQQQENNDQKFREFLDQNQKKQKDNFYKIQSMYQELECIQIQQEQQEQYFQQELKQIELQQPFDIQDKIIKLQENYQINTERIYNLFNQIKQDQNIDQSTIENLQNYQQELEFEFREEIGDLKKSQQNQNKIAELNYEHMLIIEDLDKQLNYLNLFVKEENDKKYVQFQDFITQDKLQQYQKLNLKPDQKSNQRYLLYWQKRQLNSNFQIKQFVQQVSQSFETVFQLKSDQIIITHYMKGSIFLVLLLPAVIIVGGVTIITISAIQHMIESPNEIFQDLNVELFNPTMNPFQYTIQCLPLRNRFLFLDGGGIKGLAILNMLKRIEGCIREKLKVGNDFTILLDDYFDWIIGTSTGALIGALIRKRFTVDQIIQKYTTLSKRVFKYDFLGIGNLFRLQYQGFYSIDNFKSAFIQAGFSIQETIGNLQSNGNLTNGRGKYFACVATNVTRSQSILIDNNLFPNMNLFQVIRMTTAAPYYFEPITLSNGDIIADGGLRHNNPTAFFLSNFYNWKNHPKGNEQEFRPVFISLGTGIKTDEINRGCFSLLRYLINFATQTEESASIIQTLISTYDTQSYYYRFQPEYDRNIDLDSTLQQNIDYMKDNDFLFDRLYILNELVKKLF